MAQPSPNYLWNGTLCLSICTPDPQKVIGIMENISFKAYNFMIFVKNSRGGREINMVNTLSKINSSKIQGVQQNTFRFCFFNFLAS